MERFGVRVAGASPGAEALTQRCTQGRPLGALEVAGFALGEREASDLESGLAFEDAAGVFVEERGHGVEFRGAQAFAPRGVDV